MRGKIVSLIRLAPSPECHYTEEPSCVYRPVYARNGAKSRKKSERNRSTEQAAISEMWGGGDIRHSLARYGDIKVKGDLFTKRTNVTGSDEIIPDSIPTSLSISLSFATLLPSRPSPTLRLNPSISVESYGEKDLKRA